MYVGICFLKHFYNYYYNNIGEHQMELLDYVAAKFHEEMGTFKLLVCVHIM